MDSREIHHHQQQQQHLQQQQQQQPPPGMLMTHHNSFNRNPNAAAAAALMGHTSTSQAMHQRLPFGAMPSHQPHPPQQHQHHYHHPQPQQQMDQKTLDSLGFDGSPSSVAAAQQHSMRFGIEQQQQQVKKKRGRPRKYAADGGGGGNNIALGLAPTSPLPSASNSYGGGNEGGAGGGGGDSGGANANSSDPPAKRNRGRPPGSGKKQLDALGGTGGVGFTPHVIEVKTGEDIAMKVLAFTNQGPRAICILSATGAVSNVMLRQSSSPSGIVKFEGRYEIISLSGSFLNSESNGTVTKSGNLSVSLAGQDGRIVGGTVAGMLVAGSQVQVIVGSFVPDGKKQKQSVGRAQNTPEPASAPANMLSFGGGLGSPGSQGQQHSSESSEENESNSPLHRGSNNNNNNNSHGLFGNSTPQSLQQMPMQMYPLWPGAGQNHQ
ncbi:PREDICTED: AT-hook motif nuclear-localized protein 13-like [Camelina sativa]|uniref:AT-hook motif nuclear-localized protein n=1 Tax=Camelina sativa TaxID=90675 RepID=A0ABM0V1S5_CAMSA|nr:PREDICTED: AT-hook motif nuclear-localized protein 13-like [Camelina sativa]